jgi:hypothetical protein
MHQFKVKTTRYSVTSPERQLEIEALCAKIKRNTGRPSRSASSRPGTYGNMNPVYPRCYGGESTKQYVAVYERLNEHRFIGRQYGKEHDTGKSQSLFGELSDNPQWPQNDPVIEEPLND